MSKGKLIRESGSSKELTNQYSMGGKGVRRGKQQDGGGLQRERGGVDVCPVSNAVTMTTNAATARATAGARELTGRVRMIQIPKRREGAVAGT